MMMMMMVRKQNTQHGKSTSLTIPISDRGGYGRLKIILPLLQGRIGLQLLLLCILQAVVVIVVGATDTSTTVPACFVPPPSISISTIHHTATYCTNRQTNNIRTLPLQRKRPSHKNMNRNLRMIGFFGGGGGDKNKKDKDKNDSNSNSNNNDSPATAAAAVTTFPNMIHALQEKTSDKATLQELQDLNDSFQRLTQTKEGLFALMEQERNKETVGQECKETNKEKSLQELEEMVTQLEQQAASAASKTTTTNNIKTPQDYKTKIQTIEKQVQAISKQHEQFFQQKNNNIADSLQQTSKQVPVQQDFKLKTLEEINQQVQVKVRETQNATYIQQILHQVESKTEGKEEEEEDPLYQNLTHFSLLVNESFADLKAQLNAVLAEVKQDRNNYTFTTRTLSNGSSNDNKERPEKKSLLSRFKRAFN